MKLSAADCVMKVPHDASVSPATMASTGASSVSSTPSADSATDSRMVRRALVSLNQTSAVESERR